MSALRRQMLLCLVAAQFLTRFPLRVREPFDPQWTVRSTPWFPVIGMFVGSLGALVWWCAGRIWGPAVASVAALAVTALATGGLHEDGLADCFDGLFAGGSREARLAAMKDSRIGAAGVLALIVFFSLRAASLASLSPGQGVAALVLAHGAGRAAAVVAMACLPYAGDVALAKARLGAQRPTGVEALAAAAIGAAPLLAWGGGRAALALFAVALGVGALLRVSRRAFGGQTGDVLGAAEQIAEAAVILAAAARI